MSSDAMIAWMRRQITLHEESIEKALSIGRDVSRLWKALQRNEEAIAELRGVVSPLPAKCEPIAGQLTLLRAELDALRRRINQVACQTSNLAARVAKPGDELADLQRDLEGLARVVTRLSHDDCDQREEQRQASAKVDGRRIKTTRNERFRRSIVLGGKGG